MRKLGLIAGLFTVLGVGVGVGLWTGQRAANNADPGAAPAAPEKKPTFIEVRPPAGAPAISVAAATDAPQPITVPAPVPELSRQEKYDAALLDALNLVAGRKYAEALKALEVARGFQDTEQIRTEIARVQVRLEMQLKAETTVQDIQTVLKDGKPDEAARLASGGLGQFEGTGHVDRLTTLKRQADALTATGLDDPTARRGRFQIELGAAVRDNNLRAAALALEQLLLLADDSVLKKQLDGIRATLVRYDQARQRALDLRRDPANLENAIAALEEAGKAWDTLETRQDLDDYRLALQKRRDRIAVADFEMRGDAGLPGGTLAEALLPAFKCRFDLVERGQLGKVVDELRLEASDLADNDGGRQEIGRLARVRYLVVGSVTRLSAITVSARLVDVRTGLVVQTGKIVALTPEEIVRSLPMLANQLMMSDEQKLAYEQQMAAQRPPEVAPAEYTVVPPCPEPPSSRSALPPPLIVYAARPPACGEIRVEDFDALPLAIIDRPPPVPVIVVERERRVKNRLLRVLLDLGDNLFRRGQYREAHAQFQLALNVSPGEAELRLRLERCRPRLVAPVVAVVPRPSRPRIAVLSFVVNAEPALAPPGFGDWAAEQIACHFTPAYEVVDRGELFWYMGRMGLSVRDVLIDASARRWLARALNVRFFVFGMVQQTHSFDVSTHFVDAESGVKQGMGHIHVQDRQELKLRTTELVAQTLKNPAERARLEGDARANEKQLSQARQLLKAGKAAETAAFCQTALKQRPGDVGMRVLLQQAEQQTREAKLDAARRAELARQETQVKAARQRREALAGEAKVARIRTLKEATARNQAALKAIALKRERAHADLMAQGQKALQQRQYQQAVQVFESAQALKPTGAGTQLLAQARTQALTAAKQKAAQEQTQNALAQQRTREAEAAKARARVLEEGRQKQAEEQARKVAQDSRDSAAYETLLSRGKTALAEKKLDQALNSFQAARRIRKTDEVDRLIDVVQKQIAQATVQRRDPPHPTEKARTEPRATDGPKKAEEAARQAELQRQEKERSAAQLAAEKKKADALRQEELQRQEKDRNNARLAAERAASQKATDDRAAAARKTREDQQRLALFNSWMAKGRAAMTAKRYSEAVQAFAESRKLQPASAAAASAFLQAQQALQPSKKPAPTPPPPAPSSAEVEHNRQIHAAFEKGQNYAAHMSAGQKAMGLNRYSLAVKELEAALKLFPKNPEAMKALSQAKQGRP